MKSFILPSVTVFFGTIVGRHPHISVNEAGQISYESEMFDVDISAYAPYVEGGKSGKIVTLPEKARIQFTRNAYRPGRSYEAYEKAEKTLNSLTVGTDIAFQVESGEDIDPLEEKVGYRITDINILGNKRLYFEEYLFSFYQ